MNAVTNDNELDLDELLDQLEEAQAKINQGLRFLNQAATDLSVIRLAVGFVAKAKSEKPASAKPNGKLSFTAFKQMLDDEDDDGEDEGDVRVVHKPQGAYAALADELAKMPAVPVTPSIKPNVLDDMVDRAPEEKPGHRVEIDVPRPVPIEEPLIETDEWKRIKDSLEHGTETVFVTGGAGVGKTTLLHQIIEQTDKSMAVIAPTGVAALRAGGQTMHSFLKLPPNALDEDDITTDDSRLRSKLKGLDTLVIDEVSMLRADGMDAVNLSLQKNRGNTLPFGGVRVILFGDPFQLPPVVKEKEEKRWLKEHYGIEEAMFFHAACWREKLPAIHELTHVFRQKDEGFIKALNAVRDGSLNQEQLDLLNKQVDASFARKPHDDLWITLTTTNAAADLTNQRMIDGLKTEARTFEAFTTGDFNLKDAPTDLMLTLKPGAAVMFIRNDSVKSGKRWVNGTLGKVTSVRPLRVEVDGLDHAVEMETWEKIAYEYDPKTKKLAKTIVGSFTQIPLKLAAAITIHKSQGCSMDRVIIDLGTGTFASGQLYTALSRCRTLEGIRLLRPLRMEDLRVNAEVQRFMKGEPIARPVVKPEPQPMLPSMEVHQ